MSSSIPSPLPPRPEDNLGVFDPVQKLIPRRPQALSAKLLRWLESAGYLTPSRRSPLAFARDPEDRGKREPHDSRVPAYPPLVRALKILESPRVRLRFGITGPGEAPSLHEFFVREGEAVYGVRREDGYSFAPPVPLGHLVETLAGGLRCRPLGTADDALAMLPKLFRLVSALWTERGKSAREPISAGEIQEILARADFGSSAGSDLLRAMTGSGVLEQRPEGIFLHPGYFPWLELVSSGHVFEIECSVEADDGWYQTRDNRLLFVGPPGRRILCDDVELPAGEADPEVSGERLFLFNRPSPFELRERLARILPPATGMPVAGPRTEPPRTGLKIVH